MDGFRLPLAPELRDRWRRRSEAAFERMYGNKNQDQLVTMTQREDMAMLIAKELAAFLLEEHLALDPAVRPHPEAAPVCPRCGQPGRRAMKSKEPLPDRRMRTRAGDIKLERERWRCPKCRILFFSAGCSAATGDGGL